MSRSSSPTPVTRRAALGVAAASATALGLAACGGSRDDGSSGSDDQMSPTGSSSSAAGRGGAALVALADVPVGGAVSATSADGRPLIIAQPSEGTVVGFSAICTHMACTVAPAGEELHCPCHASAYEAATGKNLSGPAPRPLEPFAVRLDGDQVVSGA